jgi:hypothetical protein
VALAPPPAGGRLPVLAAETVAAVSAAVAALGKPYAPSGQGTGPIAYSCDGLVRAAYAGAGIALPAAATDQLATGIRVPLADARPGDLVFLGPVERGVQSVGIVLTGGTMVVADGRLARVVVTDLPAGQAVLGVTRPALGTTDAEPVPQAATVGPRWRCGGVSAPPRAARGEAAGPWGGYPNGMFPAATLCPVSAEGHRLRCDAARAYQALSKAFQQRFDEPLCVTDSYRSFDVQLELYRRKPLLAAVPGTSNHGWGLAVDLCGGAQSYDSAEYAWLRAHARGYGWANPRWARHGTGREEPWHWEFVGG